MFGSMGSLMNGWGVVRDSNEQEVGREEKGRRVV